MEAHPVYSGGIPATSITSFNQLELREHMDVIQSNYKERNTVNRRINGMKTDPEECP